MSRSIEKEIIEQYVKKNKQERIIWELDNPKKRSSVIWRFHRPKIFIEKCLKPIGYMDKKQMIKYLSELSGAVDVYFIGEIYIGYLSLEEAAEQASRGGICIIYCGKGIGYYQGEQEIGAPPRFMLLAKD